jgi:methylmalonyl-CoA mutase C-terminal domain/subunit
MEVIYTGLRQTPEMVVRAAIDEAVNCIGLSILSGAHMALFPKVMALLKKEGADDILVVGGGIIPEDDVAELKKVGIAEIFGPGTPLDEITEYIKANVKL